MKMPVPPDRCSCHAVQEGSGGVSFSYAMLGVNCDACESYMAAMDFYDRYMALSVPERIAHEMSNARARLDRISRSGRFRPNYGCPF